MKRKLTAWLAVLLVLPVLLLSVCGVNGKGLPLVCDGADLLTAEEEARLEEKAQELLENYAMDIVILTTETLDGQSPQDYADDYFDYAGYGVGDDRSGALFLLSMEERDLYVSTRGDAIYALTDYGIDKSTELTLPYLGEGAYYDGFAAWLDALPAYFDALEAGTPIDGNDYAEDFYHGDREEAVYYEDSSPSILLSLMIAVPIAAIAVLIMRFFMNTKRPQHSAEDYMKPGSFDLRNQQDIFLYSQVTKREKPKDPPPSSGGGGSSVHTSSSGASHGGGGRKF